ncbi:MAG: hypothetical protein HRU41_32525 [Saprospiraceae bacterium]|nr:hypothetical protein [Saprospiraceae bacterium]
MKVILRSNLRPQKHISEGSCIILGNGPSLKKVLSDYAEVLENHTLVCVNKFPDTEHYVRLKPRYYVICSEEFWATDTIDPHHQGRLNMIKAAVERTTWPLFFYIPESSKSNPVFLQEIRENTNITIVFYNTTPVEGLPGVSNWLLRNRLGSPRPHNVLIPSILNMINSGFETIALVGADHSWIPMISVDENNNALVNQQHFYDAESSKSQRMYRSGKKPRKLYEILEKFMFSFRAYFDLKDLAESKGVNIYNCTEGSFIDAFDRKPISEVLES